VALGVREVTPYLDLGDSRRTKELSEGALQVFKKYKYPIVAKLKG
jgi:hypothetical protein